MENNVDNQTFSLDEVLEDEAVFKALLLKLFSKDPKDFHHIEGTSDNVGASFQEVVKIILEDTLSEEDKAIIGVDIGARDDFFR